MTEQELLWDCRSWTPQHSSCWDTDPTALWHSTCPAAPNTLPWDKLVQPLELPSPGTQAHTSKGLYSAHCHPPGATQPQDPSPFNTGTTRAGLGSAGEKHPEGKGQRDPGSPDPG